MARQSAYDSDEALKLENQLCFPLYAASRKIVSAYTPYLKPLGITYTQYITFMVLWEEDGLFVGDICARLHLDNGTLTPLLKKMEKQGFVVRRRDEADERKVRVFLTDEGRAMKDRVRDIPRKVGSCVDLDAEEAQTLYRLLYKLLDEA
ncbi:MAG: MarR family winged helix-turn-helix transcriptional regulator [Eggerthellaceae bacterium]|jgi:DNA-binding MarR family transcriptional regulator